MPLVRLTCLPGPRILRINLRMREALPGAEIRLDQQRHNHEGAFIKAQLVTDNGGGLSGPPKRAGFDTNDGEVWEGAP